MSAPDWEDLSAFLLPDSMGGFAKQARFSINGVQKTCSVLFDDPAIEAKLGGYEADASEPTITGRAVDFVGIKRGTAIEVIGVGQFYANKLPYEDGTGMAVIDLSRQARHGQR